MNIRWSILRSIMKTKIKINLNCPYIKNNILVNAENTWCKKLGCTIYETGGCCESEVKNVRKAYSRQRKLNGYKRKIKYKNKMKHLAKITSNDWLAPVYPVGDDGEWSTVDDAVYFRRDWRGSRSKIFKKVSNKKLRNYKGDIPKNGGYRKVFDLWWEIY